MSGEILASRLNTFHNVCFYQNLMAKIRHSIEEERFSEFSKAFCMTENAVDKKNKLR
jgi:queuine tRNA-ribosyltransferase